ncbi:MAG: hypothetical protein QM692_08190 [Thermomicrobiales bacterium]
MPRIPLEQLFPAIDQHPPRWVRTEDGQYRPDLSDYPADAPRPRVVMRDPLTGVLMLELPTVETEAEDLHDVDDGEPDTDRAIDDAAGAETDTDAGAAASDA